MLDQFRWAVLSPGDKVLVAVSGGPDSLSLLHLLWTEREARQIRVEAAHLDHGLRGTESAAEADWVADWCRERGIACYAGRRDVSAFASAQKQSKQEAARTVRYAFLEQTAAAIGADKIATGHTRNDQAETVLANILRGTGTDGLRGIPARRGLFIRPLLDVWRTDIEAYCAANQLLPRQDPSNFSSAEYTRNRIRLELLPLLRQGYNARVEDALLRLSEIAARDSDFLAMQAEDALAGAVVNCGPDCLTLDRAMLAALHPALLRYVLRHALLQMCGTLEGVTYEHLEQICGAVLSSSPALFALTLPSPLCTVRVTNQVLTLFLADTTDTVGPLSASLPVPGEAVMNEIGWTVQAAWEDHAGAVRVSADAVDMPSLLVRNRRTGDKIDPLGMGGRHKKVADIFSDAKVPRSERELVPLVADSHGIVWIAGHMLAERVKVTADTARVVFLSVQAANTRKSKQETAAETGNKEKEEETEEGR